MLLTVRVRPPWVEFTGTEPKSCPWLVSSSSAARMPVPVNGTPVGEPPAMATVSSLRTSPAAPGAKVTDTVHCPLAGIMLPVQVFAETAKLGLPEVTATPVTGAFWVLRRVTTAAGLVRPTATSPKSTEAGLATTVGRSTPVPCTATLKGEESGTPTDRVPMREPTVEGAKETSRVQVPPAGNGPVQLLVFTGKS